MLLMVPLLPLTLPRRVPPLRRRLRVAPAAAVLLLTVTACGGSADSDSSASPSAAASSAAPSTSSAAPTASSATTSAAPSTGSQATPAIVAAADAFLSSLSADEKGSVLFDRDDNEQKTKWSNLPEGLFERSGLMVGDLDQAKVEAFLEIMQATLSQEGYDRVVKEWNADEALTSTDSGGGPGNLQYGKQYYWMAIIGEPSETEPWQWQFGGHHVTVNATVEGNDLSLTPSFIGAQPTSYDSDGEEVRPLGDIEAEAFALVDSLDETAQDKAVLGDSYIDLVAGPGQDGRTVQAEGLPGSEMSADQQDALLKLIMEYGGLANAEDAAARESQLESDLDETTFAWYGPTTEGEAAYFRVTGPSVLIEYSPQSMGGDATEHIHGIYRDPTNDYGGTIS